jgi:hypothetical protein
MGQRKQAQDALEKDKTFKLPARRFSRRPMIPFNMSW